MEPHALDHVALWVADRPRLAAFLCEHLGMHEISEGDGFTLLGADARRGKLTLFDAEGPREAGVLERVVLRVEDVDAVAGALPESIPVSRPSPATAEFEAPEGLGIGLAAANGDGIDYDLDHVVLRVSDTERTFAELAALGFSPAGDRLTVADKHVRLVPGGGANGRPLLNHLALLVDSAERVRAEAEARSLEIDRIVDAENTIAVFVRGPEEILLEYVEHKPGFSLV